MAKGTSWGTTTRRTMSPRRARNARAISTRLMSTCRTPLQKLTAISGKVMATMVKTAAVLRRPNQASAMIAQHRLGIVMTKVIQTSRYCATPRPSPISRPKVIPSAADTAKPMRIRQSVA